MRPVDNDPPGSNFGGNFLAGVGKGHRRRHWPSVLSVVANGLILTYSSVIFFHFSSSFLSPFFLVPSPASLSRRPLPFSCRRHRRLSSVVVPRSLPLDCKVIPISVSPKYNLANNICKFFSIHMALYDNAN